MIRAHCTHLYEHELAIKVRYDEEVGVIFLLGARASCPRRRDEGGTPSLRGAYVTPGVNSYEDQQTKALQAGGALPGDAFFRHALASHLWFKASGCPTFTGWFLGSPCIPSLVLGFRMPNLPLLPVWEKGVGGMRGQKRPTSPFSPCGLKGGGFRAISCIGTGHRYAW